MHCCCRLLLCFVQPTLIVKLGTGCDCLHVVGSKNERFQFKSWKVYLVICWNHLTICYNLHYCLTNYLRSDVLLVRVLRGQTEPAEAHITSGCLNDRLHNRVNGVKPWSNYSTEKTTHWPI